MKITLIRHAETTWNALGMLQGQADPPLTQKGVDQAKILADRMKQDNSNYNIIFSSERLRARQVAEILSEHLSIPVIYNSKLNSRNLGDFSGKSLEELEENLPLLYKKYISNEIDFAPPNGESTRQVLKRCENFLTEIKSNYDTNHHIVLVTHRGNIGKLHYLITGEHMEDPLRSVKNCHPYTYQIKFSETS